MQMDQATGEIRLPGGVLGPTLTRDAFHASPLADGAEIFVQNEPWCSFKLAQVPVLTTQYIVVVFFHGQRLTMVHLTDADPEFGASWDDWSEEKELRKKARHAAWLREVFDLPVGTYAWGDVASEYDVRSGGSSIIVTYRGERPPHPLTRIAASIARRLRG
jgi:hypothetical protein